MASSKGAATLITLESTVVVAPKLVSCELEGEAAILNLSTGIYYGLDKVGASIWEMISHPVKVSLVRDAMLERYEVEADRCAKDLLALLVDLNERGLIEVINDADPR
jgi:hypothetical protein